MLCGDRSGFKSHGLVVLGTRKFSSKRTATNCVGSSGSGRTYCFIVTMKQWCQLYVLAIARTQTWHICCGACFFRGSVRAVDLCSACPLLIAFPLALEGCLPDDKLARVCDTITEQKEARDSVFGC